MVTLSVPSRPCRLQGGAGVPSTLEVNESAFRELGARTLNGIRRCRAVVTSPGVQGNGPSFALPAAFTHSRRSWFAGKALHELVSDLRVF